MIGEYVDILLLRKDFLIFSIQVHGLLVFLLFEYTTPSRQDTRPAIVLPCPSFFLTTTKTHGEQFSVGSRPAFQRGHV